MNLAPIVLFVYNRTEHTRKTLDALQNCDLANQSDLYIFADGPKQNATSLDLEKINQTRAIIREQKWCKNVFIIESEINKGLSKNIIEGVTKIVNQYGKVIVLEDDLAPGKFFLTFVNDALQRYENDKKVYHINGYRYPVPSYDENRAFFNPIMDCWGWATWVDRWSQYEKDAKKLKKLFTGKMIKRFNADGSYPDNWLQVILNLNGDIDTWAIFWYATIFLNDGLCLTPCISQIVNNGLNNVGTNIHTVDDKLISIKSGSVKIDTFPLQLMIDKVEYEKNKRFFKGLKCNNKMLVFVKQLLSNLGLFRFAKKIKIFLRKKL